MAHTVQDSSGILVFLNPIFSTGTSQIHQSVCNIPNFAFFLSSGLDISKCESDSEMEEVSGCYSKRLALCQDSRRLIRCKLDRCAVGAERDCGVCSEGVAGVLLVMSSKGTRLSSNATYLHEVFIHLIK